MKSTGNLFEDRLDNLLDILPENEPRSKFNLQVREMLGYRFDKIPDEYNRKLVNETNVFF